MNECNICPLCLDDIIDNNIFITKCNHYFHESCFYEYLWFKTGCDCYGECGDVLCPLCRFLLKITIPQNIDFISYIHNNNNNIDNNDSYIINVNESSSNISNSNLDNINNNTNHDNNNVSSSNAYNTTNNNHNVGPRSLNHIPNCTNELFEWYYSWN